MALPSKRLYATALLALVTTGCLAERHLIVETSPPGALVEIDWEPVGVTPLDLVIEHHGSRRLFVTLDGHEPVLRDVDFPSTWASSFPLDIFTELLNPFPKDEILTVTLTLTPLLDKDTADLSPVLERAELLRRAGPSGPRGLERTEP